LLKNHADKGKFIGAICAAPKAVAAAGLLEGRKATAYPGVLEALGNEQIEVKDTAIEIDGKIVTSRGPGTAMDFALTLIELLEGRAKRDEVNRQLVR
jgi:4-methyl-5(b-hydroxyethyl)-thiazole monophosphate biosynthesis